jgi:glycosyltransferase involved in cell wall biosynthesis
MNKKKIVIASVLKPVNDSRNYEKTAISINKSGNYQVYLVGQKVQELPIGSSILFNPLFAFRRTSIKRFFAGWTFLLYMFRINPQIVVVTTAELLLPAVIFKMIRGGKLIYDVQENYLRNLLYTSSFPPVLKHIMAVVVRIVEYFTRPFVNQYILAERNYEKEFFFSKNKSIIIENKLPESLVLPLKREEGEKIQFLYTGTIAENYGVFEAVDFIKKLYVLDNKIRFVIVGFAAEKVVFEKLKEKIEGFGFISLKGGDKFVPHREILGLIASSDFGLIPYRANKSTENCIPTKMYEYLAYRLPYIISKNSIWQEITEHYQAGIVIDFFNFRTEEILKQMKEKNFYETIPGKEIYWEEEKLVQLLNKY